MVGLNLSHTFADLENQLLISVTMMIPAIHMHQRLSSITLDNGRKLQSAVTHWFGRELSRFFLSAQTQATNLHQLPISAIPFHAMETITLTSCKTVFVVGGSELESTDEISRQTSFWPRVVLLVRTMEHVEVFR